MKKILIDSGPLIALFDASDKYHKKAVDFIKSNKYPLVTTIASITETLHLLNFNRNAQIDFIEWVYQGAVEVQNIENDDFGRIKYKYSYIILTCFVFRNTPKCEKCRNIWRISPIKQWRWITMMLH